MKNIKIGDMFVVAYILIVFSVIFLFMEKSFDRNDRSLSFPGYVAAKAADTPYGMKPYSFTKKMAVASVQESRKE